MEWFADRFARPMTPSAGSDASFFLGGSQPGSRKAAASSSDQDAEPSDERRSAARWSDRSYRPASGDVESGSGEGKNDMGRFSGWIMNGPAAEADEPAKLPVRTPQLQSFGL
jgi:hypothetical protein